MPPKPPIADTTLNGVLERIIFFNEENHYCIGEFRPNDTRNNITITGSLPSVQCGETLELHGTWSDHPKHGKQFKIAHFKSTLPSSVYGIRKYLGSGLVPGIGKVYAEKIVDHFGVDTLDVITENSGRLREVEGIGKQRAKAIKKAWDDQAALREIMMFLKTYGVTTSQCLRLVKKYGNEAKLILQNDPYRVAREIDGIGFKTADKIALNLGFSNESHKRIDGGILHALAELESEGHTCFPFEALEAHSANMLEVPQQLVQARIGALVEAGELRAPEGTGMIQLPVLERAEEIVAKSIANVVQGVSLLPSIIVDKAIEWAQERAGFEFAPEQAQGVRTALTSKVSIITGGPGTGKTTILRALVDILRAKKVRITLAAPTGRAAQRMTESTRAYAQTIHRLLAFDAAEGRFSVNEDNPLPASFVIVDETSMLDTRLAAALFRSVQAGAHLLLVGDVNQLPSVGPGNVLGDLMSIPQVRVVALEKIFRQKFRSKIVTTAHGLLQGNSECPSPVDDPSLCDPKVDLHFVRAETPERCLEVMRELATTHLPRWFQCDAVMDVQVLAPMHRGVAGVGNLNHSLQEALNPGKPGISFGELRYTVGDKVIQTRNDYDKNIFNGELGRITHINADAGTLAASFDEGPVDFERLDLTNLQLAYAITIHKSQGSEFPIVLIPLLKQHFMMLKRNLLYTAITRGRKKVFVVGDPVAWSMAANNTESTTRYTDLPRKVTVLTR